MLLVLFSHRDKFLWWGDVSRSDVLMFVFITVTCLLLVVAVECHYIILEYLSGSLNRIEVAYFRFNHFINRDVYQLICGLVYITLLGSYFSNPLGHNETGRKRFKKVFTFITNHTLPIYRRVSVQHDYYTLYIHPCISITDLAMYLVNVCITDTVYRCVIRCRLTIIICSHIAVIAIRCVTHC